MMFMGLSGDSSNGPAGLTCDGGQVWNDFYSSCVDACPSGQSYDNRGICSGAVTSSGGTSQSDPWWATLTRALATGATVGAGQLIVGQTPHPTPAPPPTPWYMTPAGILGIVIVIGGGAYLIAKK